MVTNETTVKNLFRRFSHNVNTAFETGQVIGLLQDEQSKRWFAEVMDEVHPAMSDIPTDHDPAVEKRFEGLVTRLHDFTLQIEIQNM